MIDAGERLVLEVVVGMLESITNDASHLANSCPLWERSVWVEHMMARAIICELLLLKVDQSDPRVAAALDMVVYCEVELGKHATVMA